MSSEDEFPPVAADSATREFSAEPAESAATFGQPLAGTWPVSESGAVSSPALPTTSQLVHLACRLYDARRARNRLLGDDIFGEPAWDILLACYCLPARGEPVSVIALAHAANVPKSTGHRWQRILMKRGLIERGGKCSDGRRQLVQLSRNGRELLERYLASLFCCNTPPPPFPEQAGGGTVRSVP